MIRRNSASDQVIGAQENDVIVRVVFAELFVRAKCAGKSPASSHFIFGLPGREVLLCDTVEQGIEFHLRYSLRVCEAFASVIIALDFSF